MSISLNNIKFVDTKNLSVELEFIVACSRIAGNELIKIALINQDMADKFKSAAARILKSMKRDGIIKLFVFENELSLQEKTESVYLLNKFPFLSDVKEASGSVIYVKL